MMRNLLERVGVLLYSRNVLRFAVGVAIVDHFAYKIEEPYYLQFMTTERSQGVVLPSCWVTSLRAFVSPWSSQGSSS